MAKGYDALAGFMFVLEPDGTTRPAKDLAEWIANQEECHTIARDEDETHFVSTIFMGIDAMWGIFPGRAPFLFETMVFDKETAKEQFRYPSLEDARRGHAEACQKWLGRKPADEQAH